MGVEAGAEPMLDLAFDRGRAIWIPRENTEEEQNKEKDSEQRRAQKPRRDTEKTEEEQNKKEEERKEQEDKEKKQKEETGKKEKAPDVITRRCREVRRPAYSRKTSQQNKILRVIKDNLV